MSARTDTERLDWLANRPHELRRLADVCHLASEDDPEMRYVVVRLTLDTWIQDEAAEAERTP